MLLIHYWYIFLSYFREVPRTLRALLPWLTPDVPTHWTGIDPGSCSIFLPSLAGEFRPDDLPVVPPSQSAEEELVYTQKIVEPQPWVGYFRQNVFWVDGSVVVYILYLLVTM